MSSLSIRNCTDEATSIKQVQEIIKLVQSIKSEQKKHNQYKIIKDVVFECAKGNKCALSRELCSKVYNILLAAEVEPSLELTNNFTILGLNPATDFNIADITYEEKLMLQEAVEQGLREKHRNILKDFDFGISVEEDESITTQIQSELTLNTDEKLLLYYKGKLTEKQDLYVKYLQEFSDILEQIINLKTKHLPEVTHQKLGACEIESKLSSLKAEILNIQSRATIFDNNSLDAYKEIFRDIREQQVECKQDIEKLQVLKEKYKQVSCKQYDEILKSYLYYKSNIDKKRLLCNKLHK